MVVGLHLASGRALSRNHDSALSLLVDTLNVILSAAGGLLDGEIDILLAGDLNLDYFDNDPEEYLEAMVAAEWDLLADRSYPFTRLGAVPLRPNSRLDYLICTDAMRGPRRIIASPVAEVHIDIAQRDYDSYRRVLSDHMPITLKIRIVPDDD